MLVSPYCPTCGQAAEWVAPVMNNCSDLKQRWHAQCSACEWTGIGRRFTQIPEPSMI
jgi:hypothetical protein